MIGPLPATVDERMASGGEPLWFSYYSTRSTSGEYGSIVG